MTIELQMLVATAVLAFLHPIPYVFSQLQRWGLMGAVSNRVNMPELQPWAERARRAHQNTTENFAHFAVFVLVANYLGISNELTVLGATLFFWSRLGFIVTYIAGIIWVRSLMFAIGLVGEAMIIGQLLLGSS